MVKEYYRNESEEVFGRNKQDWCCIFIRKDVKIDSKRSFQDLNVDGFTDWNGKLRGGIFFFFEEKIMTSVLGAGK